MIRPVHLALFTIPVAAGLTACGGTRHIGDITPVVTERLSGAWVYNAKESDDPASMVPRGGEGPGQRRGEGQWGGRGGRPGGGAFPGGGMGGRGGVGGEGGEMGRGGMRRPGGGGRVDPEAMREVRRLAMTVPTRIDIALSDSLVTVTYAGQDPFVLPFGKKVERPLGDHLELETKAVWSEGRLVVERDVSGGGGVSETFMPSVDGARLTIDVDFTGGPGGGFDFQRVYNHPEAKAGSGASG